MGLSMALAVGDSRLALQSFVVVGGSMVVVIATAAGLTAVLPFQTVTLEISSRVHPTTLDLGVAICSGLVGALVTVARGQRLSAAIPGVAVAVALIPPLAVAGFGMAASWQTDLIWGSLLLLGANLAGIVLSGVLVFLLIGMHRGDVVEAARKWHDGARPNGLAAMVVRLPGVNRARVFGSATGRVALVFGFVVALAFPLTVALTEVMREVRVRGAVADAETLLEVEGMTSVLERQVELGPDSATVHIRVATTLGVSGDAQEAFRRRATELAGEPVDLRLEQVPVSAGDASALKELLRGGRGAADDRPATWPETLARARQALEQAAWALPLPEGAQAIGVTLRVAGEATVDATDSVEVAYLAPAPLEPQAVDVLGAVLRQAVGHAALATSFHRAGPAVVALEPADNAGVAAVVALLREYPGLQVRVHSAPGDSLAAASVVAALRAGGAAPVSVESPNEPGAIEVRLTRPPR